MDVSGVAAGGVFGACAGLAAGMVIDGGGWGTAPCKYGLPGM